MNVVMNYIRTVLSALRKADNDFSLIEEGDRIALGLSGGKDSLALLRALSVYGHFAKKHFEVFPIYLDLGFKDGDYSEMQKYVESLGYSLYVSDSRFVYEILKAHQKPGKNLPCSICSRMKKAAINSMAKKLKCNKVAFAHHADDAIETLFMNMLHGGRIATFEPKMKLEKAGVTFIRPLYYCYEKDLTALVKEENLPVYDQGCPANKHTEREYAKNLVKDLASHDQSIKENLRTMLTNYERLCLPYERLEIENDEDPSYALRPVLSAEDMRLTSFATRKKKDGEVCYLVLHHHERVGEIAYRYLDAHKAEIYGLRGDKKTKGLALAQLEKMLSKKTTPITLILLGESKLAPEKGYKRAFLRDLNQNRYIKRLEK